MADDNGALDGGQQGADSHEEVVVQLLLVPDVVAQVFCSPARSHLALCQHSSPRHLQKTHTTLSAEHFHSVSLQPAPPGLTQGMCLAQSPLSNLLHPLTSTGGPFSSWHLRQFCISRALGS